MAEEEKEDIVQLMKFHDTTSANYVLVDIDTGTPYGTFKTLTGGDKKISMISYNVVGENGGIETRFMPGQISYAPIKLTCDYADRVKDITDWFYEARDGLSKAAKRNCNITLNLVSGDAIAEWTLTNVMPVALPGFSVHAYQRTKSTSFKIVLQAERIDITYP